MTQKQQRRKGTRSPRFDHWRLPPNAELIHDDVDLEFVHRLICKRTGRLRRSQWFCRDDAEDLYQEAWEGMLPRLRKYDRSRGTFEPYARRCIKSVITSMARKRKSAKNRASERTKALDERVVTSRRDTDPVESAHRNEVRETVRMAEPKNHDAIRATQAGSVSEAARLAGKARSTIRGQKKKLKKDLKRFDPSISD